MGNVHEIPLLNMVHLLIKRMLFSFEQNQSFSDDSWWSFIRPDHGFCDISLAFPMPRGLLFPTLAIPCDNIHTRVSGKHNFLYPVTCSVVFHYPMLSSLVYIAFHYQLDNEWTTSWIYEFWYVTCNWSCCFLFHSHIL